MCQKGQKVAKYAGNFGLSARDVTLSVIGMFMVIAAIQLNPSKVKSVGEALDVLARQPYDAWVLLAVAFGLVCHGVFCLVRAKYRT